MNNKNICKFVLSQITGTLTTLDFVYETDKKTMQTKTALKSNRMILVSSGKNVFHFNETAIEAEVGCMLFGFKDETVFSQPSAQGEYMYIDFDGGRCSEIFSRFGIEKENRCFGGYQVIIPLWEERLSMASEITIDLVTEGLLLYSFSRLVSEAKKQESLVGKMIKITKENFVDPNLSIRYLADELSYNGKYLSHAFKEEIGIRYSEYLRNMRLKFAISLFDNGIDSVKNVALLSGFSDSLYFSTVFTKNIGVTPSEYKTKHTANQKTQANP